MTGSRWFSTSQFKFTREHLSLEVMGRKGVLFYQLIEAMLFVATITTNSKSPAP